MALAGTLAVTTSLTAGVGPSVAQDPRAAERQVVLRMRGGDLQVSGELKSFDGSRYVIESSQGRLTLQASRFDCQGPACTVLSSGTGWAAEQLSVDRPETIVLRGPDPVMQVMPALIRAYAASAGVQAVQLVGTTRNVHRWRLADTKGAELATIELHVATNEQALQGLAAGSVAIAMTGRLAREPEVEALSALGAGTTVVAAAGSPGAPPPKRSMQGHEHSVGSQGLAVIVSPDNPMSGITLDALARILSGQVTDWYELGLPPGRIVLHGASEGADSFDRLREMVLQPRGLQAAAMAQRAASETAAADAVARDRNGIALVSFAAVRSARGLNIESACGLVHRPTVFGVKAEEYPLSQPLYLYAATPARQAAAHPGRLRGH